MARKSRYAAYAQSMKAISEAKDSPVIKSGGSIRELLMQMKEAQKNGEFNRKENK